MSARLLRPIALVGMMGAGKTSVGRALAARLGWRFVDSDEEVEREAGCSIAELFEREGEAAFRERERRVIAAVLDGSPLVLATGGGAMADDLARRLLTERSLTIWLDAEPPVLAQRLKGAQDRPLLGVDPRASLSRLSAERRGAYAASEVQVITDDKTVEQVATNILAMLAA